MGIVCSGKKDEMLKRKKERKKERKKVSSLIKIIINFVTMKWICLAI